MRFLPQWESPRKLATASRTEEFDLEKAHADLEKSLVCSSGKFHEVLCIWGSDLKEIGPREKISRTSGIPRVSQGAVGG